MSNSTKEPDRIAALESMVERLAGQVENLLTRNEQLEQRSADNRTQYERQLAKLEERQQRRQAELADRIKELESGKHKFEVGLAKEPLLTRVVGGNSEDEARAKFQRFNGIRGFSQENPIVCKPLAEAA